MSKIKLNKIGIFVFFIPMIFIFSCNSENNAGKKVQEVKEFPVIEVVASDTILHRDYVESETRKCQSGSQGDRI